MLTLTSLVRQSQALLETLLPRICGQCGEQIACAGLCPTCVADFVVAPSPLVWRAGIPTVAPFVYEGSVAAAITRAKFNRKAELARGLAQLVEASLRPLAESSVCTTAVPLHWLRLAERGYNLPDELIRSCPTARQKRVGLLKKLRATPHQTTLGLAERSQNTDGAFACLGLVNPTGLILVVDDVITTGATLAACAKALRAGGATNMVGFCIAQTP